MPELDPDLRALQEVRDTVARAHAACEAVSRYSQEEIDLVCRQMATAAADAAYELGRIAVEETGIGRVHYKILKNLFGAEGTWESIKDEKTVGVIMRDEERGIIEVATPAGVIAGIVPTTNPTSTAIFKALVAVKGRNAIVISPHPRARRCIGETVEVLRRAIERAGAPPDLVCTLSHPTLESTGALMKHPDVALILATGGAGLVSAAYSSGKPAYGVGPGNVPAYVDRSADVARAARWLVASQSFDNGTLCCSEQGLVLDRPIADRMLDELKRRGTHLCNEEETKALERLCNRRGGMNPDVVGIDPWRIAEMAGFSVPRHTTVLLAHQAGVGPEYPLSIEILSPLLSVHLVDGWEEGCRVSIDILRFGGLGHTLSIWARDEGVLEAWFLEKPANRICVNGPTSEGAVGYSTSLVPSMSLGCGPQAGNISSDNITARHLINVKRVAFVRRDWEAIYVRDHERAGAMSGDPAPRGSGLPGDPALTSAPAPAGQLDGTGVSNWRGNPPVMAPAGGGGSGPRARVRSAPPRPSGGLRPPLRPKVQPAPKSAPLFVEPSGTATAVLPRPAESVAPARPSTRPRAPSQVDLALTPAEIQGIMAQAGGGCPLGPCRGCPHNDVRTGACMA
ncbi:MAG: aldehyde dehydrogenase family protein [Planctomycetota bacterium]|nr:aldehyde dehydrogenase family protein [Planctomycetota bacterium]